MYYLRQRTNVSGPFTVEQIRGMLNRGRVARSDKVSTDRESWRAIGATREIIDLLHPAEPVAEEEVEVVAAPVDDRKWYYSTGGDKHEGPIDTPRLLQLIQTRHVVSTDQVWRDGFKEWQQVAMIPELAAYATQSPGRGSGQAPAGGAEEPWSIPDLRPRKPRRRKKGWF